MTNYIVAVDENGQAYLAHHGVQGQKWGVRRYQNEDGTLTAAGKSRYSTDSAHKTTKGLNRIEKENAKLRTKSAIAKIKAQKAYQKGKDEKFKKYADKAKEYDTAVEAGKNLTKKLVSDATKKGYRVSSIDKTRYTHTGRMMVSTFLAGPSGAAAVGVVDAYRAKTYGSDAGGVIAGKKYKAIRE